MTLFPEGTRRRAVFEACDRWLCFQLTGERLTCSTYLGNQLKAGTAKPWHLLGAAFVDCITFEPGHCFKNEGKA